MSLAKTPGVSREGMEVWVSGESRRGSNSIFAQNFIFYLFEPRKLTCFLDFVGLSDSQPSIDRGIGV